MEVIKYNKRKKRIFCLLTVFLFLIISSFFFNQFTQSQTIFKFWIELFSALLEEKWTLLFLALEMIAIFMVYARRNNITFSNFFSFLLEKLWGKEDVTNLKERFKWYLLTNLIIILLVIFTYMVNPIGFIYHLQFTIVLEVYMLADFIGILLFKQNN